MRAEAGRYLSSPHFDMTNGAEPMTRLALAFRRANFVDQGADGRAIILSRARCQRFLLQ